MEKEVKLNSCPFCGWPAQIEYEETPKSDGGRYVKANVACLNCGASTYPLTGFVDTDGTTFFTDRQRRNFIADEGCTIIDIAADRWNRRAATT